jgi:hypothetical protein
MTVPDLLAAVEIPHTPTAKERLMEFVRIADNTLYEFDLPGNVKNAEQFVAYMRVELSRARQLMRDRGRKIRKFKMLLRAKTYDSSKKSVHVVLEKYVNPDDMLDLLATSMLADLEI